MAFDRWHEDNTTSLTSTTSSFGTAETAFNSSHLERAFLNGFFFATAPAIMGLAGWMFHSSDSTQKGVGCPSVSRRDQQLFQSI